jgi:hypothetical protein
MILGDSLVSFVFCSAVVVVLMGSFCVPLDFFCCCDYCRRFCGFFLFVHCLDRRLMYCLLSLISSVVCFLSDLSLSYTQKVLHFGSYLIVLYY